MKRILSLLLATLLLTGCQVPPEPLPVYTDWSKLEDYQPPEEIFTRRTDAPLGALSPAKDYGSLLPYTASLAGDSYFGGFGRYGLVSAKGELITDAVYSDILQPTFFPIGYSGSGETHLPLWLLVSPRSDAAQPARLMAVAAEDGSWCTEAVYSSYRVLSPDSLLLFDETQQALFLCELNGKLTPSLSGADYALIDYEWMEYTTTLHLENSFLPGKDGNFYLVNFHSATMTPLPSVGYCDNLSTDLVCAATNDGSGMGYLDMEGNWVIAPQFLSGDFFYGDNAAVILKDGRRAIIDRSGKIVKDFDQQLLSAIFSDGVMRFWVSQSDTELHCYDRELTDITPDWVGVDCRTNDTLLWAQRGNELLYFDGITSRSLTLPEDFSLNSVSLQGTLLLLSGNQWNDAACYDIDGHCLLPMGTYSNLSCDADSSGAAYLYATKPDSPSGVDLYTTAGELLAQDVEYAPRALSLGLVRVRDELYDSYHALDGEVVFRHLVQDNGD